MTKMSKHFQNIVKSNRSVRKDYQNIENKFKFLHRKASCMADGKTTPGIRGEQLREDLNVKHCLLVHSVFDVKRKSEYK